jgi:hypothetical protein
MSLLGYWGALTGLRERINLVPRSSSSREFVRIRPSALVFATMMLSVGVLLLATNNIDPKATTRPTVPVDFFADIKYGGWKSPDGLIQFECPDTWVVQSIGPFSYVIIPAEAHSIEVSISLSMGATASLLSRVGFGNNPAPDTAPDILLKQAFGSPSSGTAPTIKPVQVGSLKGADMHYVADVPDTATRQTLHSEGELWLLSLDTKHMLALAPSVLGNDWPKMQPVFDHLVSTLKVDVPTAVKAIDAAESPTAKAPAAAGTAAPTQAATSAVPAVGTLPSTP